MLQYVPDVLINVSLIPRRRLPRDARYTWRQLAALQELYTVVHDTLLPVLSVKSAASDSHVK